MSTLLQTLAIIMCLFKIHISSGIILGMVSAPERRRFNITPPLTGKVHTQNDPRYFFRGQHPHISKQILTQTIRHCLAALKHYLNQCWPITAVHDSLCVVNVSFRGTNLRTISTRALRLFFSIKGLKLSFTYYSHVSQEPIKRGDCFIDKVSIA